MKPAQLASAQNTIPGESRVYCAPALRCEGEAYKILVMCIIPLIVLSTSVAAFAQQSAKPAWVQEIHYAFAPQFVGADFARNVYVAGISNAALSLLKYDPLGNLLWNFASGDFDGASAGVAIGGTGNVYVATAKATNTPFGTDYSIVVRRLSSAGHLAWATTIPCGMSFSEPQAKVSLGPDGSVYFAGGSYRNLCIGRLDGDGAVLWSRTNDTGDPNGGQFFPKTLLLDAEGGVICILSKKVINHGGHFFYGRLFSLVRYDRDGTLLWSATYDPGIGLDAYFDATALGPSGTLFVAARTLNRNGIPYVFLGTSLLQFDLNGAAEPRDTDLGNVFIKQILTNVDGTIFLVGGTSESGTNQLTVSRRANDGRVIWNHVIGRYEFGATRLSDDGRLIVCGTPSGWNALADGRKVSTFDYDIDGNQLGRWNYAAPARSFPFYSTELDGHGNVYLLSHPGGNFPNTFVAKYTRSVTCPAGPLDITKITALLRLNEGISNRFYYDTADPPHPTIGIGFNLDRRDARRVLRKAGADYDAILDGEPLTDEQVETLFQGDLAKTIRLARAIVGGAAYDKLPESAKEVVVDMTFNLNSKLRQFKKFLRALRKGDLPTAADELENSAFYEQVGDRGPRLKDLLVECLSE